MGTDTWYEKRQSIIDGGCRQLVAQKVVEPLSTEEEETRAWNLYELASLIEGNFHVQLDVSGLSEIERLALAGWPLIRSEEDWEHRYHWSDAGEPEGLAYKIEVFEAVDRERGFEVRTPRIPGLQYRDLDEI